MRFHSLLRAGLVSLVAAAAPSLPAMAQDAVLSIVQGSVSSRVTVSVNRAIVVESDRPFAETSVANPAIADIVNMSDRTVYILGKTPGATTMTLFDQNGVMIANVDLRVTPDLAEFKERLQEILPGENIEVRTANDGIVLSGRVSGARKLARALELAERYAPGRVTNLMVVGGTQQVMLQVRFAEMQRSVSKSLGAFLGLNSNGVISSGFESGQGPNGDFVDVNFGIGGVAVNLMLEALESRGMVRTLAEPNVVAISGHDAEFLAGGEYPVPVANSDGTVTVEYRPFGVQLMFKPTVIDGDLINLEIGTVVSSIDTATAVTANGLSVNAFKVRRANTTVEMRDGQSFAIAGLLQDNFSDATTQVPWLGDVPILGALFRSANYQRQQTELVIIITPHLVAPTTGDVLALPTDRMQIPTEADLFLFGQVERPGATASGLSGGSGYVLE